jgi:2-dehydropantoate 2-reductase
MAYPNINVCSVGGNAVSAFLSWRLQATNACDVTLVWKSGFETVSQYGISFKSPVYGNERFKPRSVVRSPEDASTSSKTPFDYVLLCVKALPDVYDLAGVIESVVAPQHTCILINTTHALGIESYIESRFPTNVVLSLVAGTDISQLGPSEFEHRGSTEIWVGPANRNPSIPASIQSDMSEALAMTLSSGQVDCKVSQNIRQQQYERMIGPIAFHPTSVLFESPNHAELLEKAGVRPLISGTIDELVAIATAQGCSFSSDFRDQTMEAMIRPTENHSTMYQDFLARRPMEIESFLGSPLKLAQEVKVDSPRIETLYAMIHHVNNVNQNRPVGPNSSPAIGPPGPRQPPMMRPNGAPMNGGPMKGAPRPGSRAPSMMNGHPPPGMMRRGPPPPNGYPPRGQSNGHPHGPNLSRRPSFEENNLDEFSHLMLYDNVADGENMYGEPNGASSSGDLTIRERELALRQREMALREREYHMQARGGRKPMPPPSQAGGFDDDDDDDYFDPMSAPGGPMVDADNIDMMSVTSRRNRKAPSASQMRTNPEMGQGPPRGRPGLLGRLPAGRNKNRVSARAIADVPGLHDSIMNDPLMGYSSNRYGNVDRQHMNQDSRANSLTAARLDEMNHGTGPPSGPYGPFPGKQNRRTSQAPGNPLSPTTMRNGGRPSPPNGYHATNGVPNGMPNGMPNGRPSPPGMRHPVPRHPPGHGNAVAPHQVEQHVGVSNLHPPKIRNPPQVRSLTGSASASAGSGDSGASAHLGSDNSAYSSASSLAHRPPIGVR